MCNEERATTPLSPSRSAPHRKLVLCVIDALAPSVLERTVAAGGAPTLAALMERGFYVPDCVAAFPSVTPVCAASIVTGAWQDRHGIAGMNWYHRDERRYVEYGSSFRASQRAGLARQLTDTVYNMNRTHLSRETQTVFELLDDADVRTAGTTYLMYRGRHRHEPQRDTALTRLASTLFRHPVMGPRELFYADIFASRRTGCRSTLGMPGVRDQHSGCVGAHLVENDLFDFLLLSLPDNDWHSHRNGPEGQLRSISLADGQLTRVIDAGGGIDRFLEDHAVLVMADHSQAPVSEAISLQNVLADLDVLALGGRRTVAGDAPERARLAVCPSQRAAMVYMLDEQDAERERAVRKRAELVCRTLDLEGVELAMWMVSDADGTPVEGVIARGDGTVTTRKGTGAGATRELRFRPGGDVVDARGRSWSVDGDLSVLGAAIHDDRFVAPDYPDVLDRVWSALACSSSGDLLLSAAPGFEFADWGGQAHIGGGSHGSLRAEDSLGALIVCGVETDSAPEQWAIRDVAGLVTSHFGV